MHPRSKPFPRMLRQDNARCLLGVQEQLTAALAADVQQRFAPLQHHLRHAQVGAPDGGRQVPSALAGAQGRELARHGWARGGAATIPPPHTPASQSRKDTPRDSCSHTKKNPPNALRRPEVRKIS